MADKITRRKFIAATGRKPEQDDLERCNCQKAGEIGHWFCGWDYKYDLPMFETCGRRNREEKSNVFVLPVVRIER